MFGIFIEGKQIGFQCYNAYIPGKKHIIYSNRVVIHPDFQGFSLGLKFINTTSAYMAKLNFIVRASFSSYPLYKARINDPKWKLLDIRKDLKSPPISRSIGRSSSPNSIRKRVKMYCFQYIPD